MTRVLLTGYGGFVGRNTIPAFEKSGLEVVEFTGRVEEAESFKEYLDRGIDHVVHLAAKTFVPDSWKNPTSFYETNVLGTLSVLGFCVASNAKLTFVSSYLYGVPQVLPTAETAPLVPTNPYALTKLAAEDACRFYAKYHDIGVSIIRPFNIYGDGQSPDFLIPTLIQQALDLDTSEVTVQDTTPKRDFIHISDLVSLVLKTVEQPPVNGTCEAYNAGSGIPTSIQELVDAIQEASDTNKTVISLGNSRPGEIPITQADITKAHDTFGWIPSVMLNNGIASLVSALRQQHP